MAYEIKLANGKTLATVDDGTKDNTSSSVTLIGKRYADYGLVFNQNTTNILENFANTVPPSNPIAGQIWFDNSVNAQSLKVYVNASIGWRALGFTNLLKESTITDDIIFSGVTSYTGTATFSSVTTFTGSTVFSEMVFNSATLSGSVASSATIVQDGGTTFNGNVSFNGGVSYPTAVTYDSGAVFNSTVEIFGTLEANTTISAAGIISSDTSIEAVGFYPVEGVIDAVATGTNTAIYAKKDIGMDASTILFLDCIGVEGATTVADTSAGTIANGGASPDNVIVLTAATVDTYRGRQSGGTLNFNGTSAYATVTDNANYDFSTSEMVMDGWIFTESASTEQVIIAKGTGTALRWEVFVSATDTLSFEYNDGVDAISVAGGYIPTFEWVHWALERETSGANAIFTLYLNGNRVAQSTVVSASYDFDDITGNVVIGRRGYGTFEYFDGNMDDIRIKKGATGYTGAFKPRQSPASSDGVVAFTNVAGKSYTIEFVEEKW